LKCNWREFEEKKNVNDWLDGWVVVVKIGERSGFVE